MNIKRYSVFLLFLACLFPQFLWAQIIGSPYSGTFRLSSEPIGEFNCTLPVDYNSNPFTIRRAAWTANDDVVTFGTPVVGDFIPNNGKTEVLILKHTRSNSINPGVGGTTPEWNWIFGNPPREYVTRNIIVYTYGGDGAGGLVKEMEIATPDLNFEGPSPFLIARVPGYPNPLVIVASSSTLANAPSDPEYSDRLPLTSRLIAFDYQSTGFTDYEWISSEKYGANVPESSIPGVKYRSGAAPGIANFDLTGSNQFPGVYVYNEIFSLDPGKNGNNKVFNGGNLGQGIMIITPGGGNTYGGSQSVSVAADVVPGNNTLELVSGNTVYVIDQNFNLVDAIQLNINGVPAPDGFTSIANIDLTNNRLDIVVTTSRQPNTPDSRLVYVWTIQGGAANLLASKNLLDAAEVSTVFHDATLNTGLAFIGDIDGNGKSEIGVASPLRLSMLYFDGSTVLQEKWPAVVTNDESGHTLITMFDFNQDGSQELVYRDEQSLRIIGGNGSNIISIPVRASTAGEGPIIADLSGNGEAEIIVTDSQDNIYDLGNRYPRSPDAKLVVFKSDGFSWAPARSVWNQYAYFSFNVNDDLTIPIPQQNHGLEQGTFFPAYDPQGCLIADRRPFNSFLVQRTLYTENGCFSSGIPIMDAKVELLEAKFLCLDGSGNNQIQVEVIVSNQGDGILPAGVQLEFSLGAEKIYESVGIDVPPGQTVTKNFEINSTVGDIPTPTLSATINPLVGGVRDFPECVYDDPVLIPVIPRPVFVIDPPDAICEGGGSILIEVENNVSDLLVGDEATWYFGDPSTGGTLLSNGLTGSDGAVFTIFPDFSLQIDDLPAAATPYKFYFVDECSNSPAKEVLVYVDPSPVIVFEVENVKCFGGDTGFISSIVGDQSYITYSLDNGTTFITSAQLMALTFSAGTYNVTVKASLNPPAACLVDFPFTIGEPNVLEFLNPAHTEPLCEPNTGSISWNIQGGNPTATFPFYTYSLSKNGTPVTGFTVEEIGGKNIINGLDGGDYLLTATDSKNCFITESFSLITQEDAVFSLQDADAICFGDDAVFEVDMTTPGVAIAVPSYEWGKVSGGVFTPITNGQTIDGGVATIENNGKKLIIKGLPASSTEYFYQVWISGENTCDQVPLDAKILVNPLPDPEFEAVGTSCFGQSNGSISLSNALTGTFNFSLVGPSNATNTIGIFENLSAGFYTITVTNTATGCPITLEPIEVTQPDALDLQPPVIGQPSCGENTGSYSIDFQGGTAPYTLVLSLGGTTLETISNFTGSNYIKSDLAPGTTYAFTLTDAKGCSITDSFALTNDPKLPIGIVLADEKICEGDVAKLQPVINTAGPRTVQWYYDLQGNKPIATGQDPTNSTISYAFDGESLVITGLPAGAVKDFYMGVSGDLYCPVIEPVSISVLPPLTVSIVATEIICFGDVVDITATATGGDGNFLFSLNGGPAQSGNVFTGLPAGNYTVTVTSGECVASSTAITVKAPPSPITLQDESNIINLGSSCNESNGIIQNVNVTGGWGNYTIEWRKDNSTTGAIVGNQLPEITGLAPDNYFLVVTDEKGCKVVFPFEVKPLPLPDLVIAEQTVCEGEDVTLTPVQTVSGASPTELIWYKNAAATDLLVEGVDPGNSEISYTILDESKLLIQGLPAGTYTYYLKVVCTGEIKEAKVVVSPAPNPDLEKTDLLCFGVPTGKIKVITNSNPDFRYSIDGGSPITQANLEALELAAGTYSITVTQIGTDCSTVVEDIVIEQPGEMIFTSLNQDSPICGEDNGSIEFQVAGGEEDYIITINNKPLSEYQVSEVDNVFSVTELALGQYDILVTDANGCKVTGQFTLEDDNSNAVQSNNLDEVFCEGEVVVLVPEITITGTVTPTFTWYLEEGLTQPIISNYNPTGSGVMYQIDPANGQLSVYNLVLGDENYFLEITDDAICAVSSRADVSITEIPSPIFKVTDILCHGELSGKIELVGGSQNDLQFSINGEPRISLVQFQGLSLAAGDYEVRTFIGNSECPDTQVLTIVEPDPFELEVSGLVNPVCGSPDGSFSFTIEGGTAPYVITINNLPLSSFNPTQVNYTYTVENLEPGTYELKITDENNCVITETVELENSNLLPISAEDMEEIICKGEAVIFNPVLNNSSGVTPSYTWYLDENLNQEIISNYDPSGVEVMYAINAQSGTLTVYNLPAGDFIYYLVLRDDKICDIVAEAAVTVTDFPSSEFEVENIVCFGEKTGKIKLVSAAVPEHRYTVNGGPSLTKAQLENLELDAGTYTIETKILNAECPDIQKVEITQPAELNLTLNSSLNPTCNEDNGDIVFTISGGVEDYLILINGKPIADYSFAEDNNRYVVNKLGPGSYIITVEDANGCTIQAPLTVELKNFDAVPISGKPMESLACEGTPLTFVPDFEAGGVDVTIRWFRDEDLTQEILSDYNPINSTVMYQIDANTGELEVFNLESGDYTYYMQLSDPQICTLSLEAKGKVNEGINAEVSATPEICFGAKDGSISVQNVTGGSGKYEYSLDNNTWSVDSDFENLVSGIYTVYIRDIGGNVPCTLYIPNVEVEGPGEAIAINDDFIQINASCDLPNGSISNLEITGGWGNHSVEWRKGNASGPVIPGDKTGATDLTPGVYVLVINDEEGCTEIVEFEILAQPKPDFEPIDPEKICEFNTATIGVINIVSGSSSTDFTWSKNPNQSGLISNGVDSNNPGVTYQIREELNSIFLDVEGLPAGSYTYYFFAECTRQEIPITIEVLATPEPVYDAVSITCHDENDGKITVISGGGADITYTFDGGITFISQSKLEAMLFGPGEFTFQAQNELGCLSEEQILTIVNPEILEIQLLDSGNTECKEESGFIEVEFSGGTPDYTLSLIKNGQKLESKVTGELSYKFENLGVGNYQVEIIDFQGCVVSLSSPLEIQEVPTQIVIEDLVEECEGEIITLVPTLDPVVSNPVFTWYWKVSKPSSKISDNQVIGTATFKMSAAGQLSISGLAPGDYSVWVEVAGDGVCEGDLKEVEISINPKPEFTAQVLDENCFGVGGSILIDSPPGQNLTFSLNGGAFISYPSKKIDGLKQGEYKISAKNEFGCITDFPDVLGIEGPQAAVSITELKITQSNCGLNDGVLSFQLDGGYPDYEIILLKGNNIPVFPAQISTGGLIKFENLPPANYKIQITDSKGCVLIKDQLILTDIPPVIEAEDVVICVGEQAVIQPELDPQTNTPVFDWYYDLALSNPVINKGAPDQFGATYQVSNTGEITATGLPARATPYSLFIAVDPGQACSPAVKKVNITVIPLPTLRVSNPSIVCDPQGTVNLNEFIEGFNPNLFDYNIIAPNGSPMRLDEITAVNQSGSYIVSASAKGRNCFTPTQRISVLIAEEELVAEFQYEINLPGSDSIVNSDVQILEDIVFEDISQGDVIIWNWDFGDGKTSSEQNPVHQYDEAGEYVVKLTTIDRFGCQSEYQRLIVALDDYLIIIPNAFTPTNVKNIFFYPKYRGIASLEFYVFNTWGELIYYSTSLEGPGWDGTLNGTDVMNGNYVYRADFVTNSGEKITKTGVFILIR